MSIIKKIYYAIINFIKIIITFIIKIITSIFNIQPKNKKKKEEIKIDNKNVNNSTSNNIETSTVTPIELPDTNPIHSNPEINPETDSSTNIEAAFVYKKSINKDTNTKNINIRKIPWTEEQLDLMFNKILEEEYDIEVKYTKYSLKDKIEKLKIKLQPKIEAKIIYYEADRELKLHDVMKKVIMDELKEKPIKELEVFKKKPKEEINIKDEIYIIATPSTKKLKLEDKPPVIKPTPIITIPKEEKEEIKEQVQEQPFIVVPLVQEPPTINLKKEVGNTIKAAAAIITNETLNTIDTIISTPKEEKKPITKQEPVATPDLNEEIKEQIEPKEEKIDLRPILIDIKPNEQVPDVEQLIQKKEETIKEEKKQKENKQEEPKQPEKMKEEEPIAIKVVPIINLNPIVREEQEIEKDLDYEIEKEELEDKDYDSIEERINKLLEQLELFLVKNEKVLTTRQKNKIYNEQERLRNIKNSLHNHKEQDISNEAISLEEEITKEEFTGLKKELQKMKLDHQIDLQDNLLSKVEDLDNLTKSQADEIEKRLIKQKLKRALRAVEIPAILSLPFIRNKYFRYFTAGLFVTNHFNFLNGILRHQTANITLPDINSIRQGRDALSNAINLNYENIEYLNYLEQEALKKHPALAHDSEYLLYINNIRYNLSINYNKLLRKQQSIDRHLARINQNAKKLKRKRYYQDINGQPTQ
ncbi:MAG: hypothetical protein IKQ29_00875 [Bacilli bacterium]|nr:hypothetical protein [Bacilli bacterium]